MHKIAFHRFEFRNIAVSGGKRTRLTVESRLVVLVPFVVWVAVVWCLCNHYVCLAWVPGRVCNCLLWVFVLGDECGNKRFPSAEWTYCVCCVGFGSGLWLSAFGLVIGNENCRVFFEVKGLDPTTPKRSGTRASAKDHKVLDE